MPLTAKEIAAHLAHDITWNHDANGNVVGAASLARNQEAIDSEDHGEESDGEDADKDETAIDDTVEIC